MPITSIPIWKEAPFVRLIIPFIAGISMAYYLRIPLTVCWIGIAFFLILLIFFHQAKPVTSFRFQAFNGLLLTSVLFICGLLITSYQDISSDPNWINHHYREGMTVLVTIEEPLSEKDKSFKATAAVQSLITGTREIPVQGAVLIYFQKDSSASKIIYGSKILFSKILLPIRNTGNPGAFDYQQYCAFQGIYNQVYLKRDDFILLPGKKENPVKKILFSIRSKTVSILRQYLHGSREAGLAEALLIGYKDDLDKALVQSYANTGVVHIIAISGMQLALIYGFLVLIFKPLGGLKINRLLKPVAIITTLWLFSIMSGASPSVLRAAVMFTSIVIGENFSKRMSIYNNLAASAFILLCYDPFWLWDTGFQLSYGAVLSIVIFQKPIYELIDIQNKIPDLIWKLLAVSWAAQVLTTPVSIYYFHQFPNYFLLTNLIAIPLSTIILFGELLLLALSTMPFIASPAGNLLGWLIRLMNGFIEHIEHLPFALWNNLQINFFQLIVLYATILWLSVWLLQKKQLSAIAALICLFSFVLSRSISFRQSINQQKIIVYNIPQHQAIDFITGRNFLFKGDSILTGSNMNASLAASRIMQRVSEAGSIPSLVHGNNIFQFGKTRILLIDQSIAIIPATPKIHLDMIILSKNAALTIADLVQIFNCNLWVFDASNPSWKTNGWAKECEQLQLSCWTVVDKGAFVMTFD